MARILAERVTAEIGDEVCVFLIGMRVNRFWKVHRWWPVASAMRRMLAELAKLPDSGFLGFESWVGNPSLFLQYWRSFEQLEAYATNRDLAHLPAWADFNRRIGSNGDVGIWHETYRVRPGDFECVYDNMPAFGLAKATKLVPASGRRESAPGRMSER
jgi:hypothetical protein